MIELPGGARIENWTERSVTLVAPEDSLFVEIRPETQGPARVAIEQHGTDYAFIYETRFSGSNLPEPREGVFLIVPSIVRQAYPDRLDLVTPVNLIRKNGIIIGCQGFAR